MLKGICAWKLQLLKCDNVKITYVKKVKEGKYENDIKYKKNK